MQKLKTIFLSIFFESCTGISLATYVQGSEKFKVTNTKTIHLDLDCVFALIFAVSPFFWYVNSHNCKNYDDDGCLFNVYNHLTRWSLLSIVVYKKTWAITTWLTHVAKKTVAVQIWICAKCFQLVAIRSKSVCPIKQSELIAKYLY